MSMYARGKKLWVKTKQADGTWKAVATGFSVGEEKAAEAALALARERVEAEAQFGASPTGVITVRGFADRWIEQRKRTVRTWTSDESRLRLYVFPVIGQKPIGDVRAKHLADLFRDLRSRPKDKNPVAPKTVHNTYAAVRALFRDAQIEGLISQSPCILTEHQLGPKNDADPEWRRHAQFTRDEAERLISDTRIPFDRRVLWALMVAGGLRVGEAAGLRWRNVDRDAKPLGSMFICTSYDTGTTKTGDTRLVPIHPTLAALLAEWRGHGWLELIGREPQADDLVIPSGKTLKLAAGEQRTATRTLKLLHRDLKLLELRERRVHDLRRTFISLARTDGAEKSMLRRVTHKAPRDVMEGYTTYDFEVVCREVVKLNLKVRGRADVIRLKVSGEVKSTASEGDEAEFGTVLGTVVRHESKNPGNQTGFRGSLLRGVGDLNP